jgi:RND superfamily putative drug exporter
MLERLARWCYNRRRLVLVLWIVGFLAFGFLGKALDGGYANSTKLPGSDAVAGYDLLKARFPQQAGDSVRVVFKADHGIDDPSVRPRVEALLAELSHQPHVSETTSPYSPQGARNISPDRTIAFGGIQLNKPGFQLQKSEGTAMINDTKKASGNGVTFAVSGNLIPMMTYEGPGMQGPPKTFYIQTAKNQIIVY